MRCLKRLARSLENNEYAMTKSYPLPSIPLSLLLSFFLSLPLSFSQSHKPNSVDHAGILQSLDNATFESGKTIYQNLCTNCHGSDGVTPPLPTARAFGEGELKFGSDPYSMFLTLTDGNGLMGPQTWMTPKERYSVIHYIRETFMRPMRDNFKEIDNGYLENLPTVNIFVSEDEKVERDFGPALASQLGRETSSVLSIKINSETTLSYDLHSMDQAGIWKGGFLNLENTQHYRERGGGVPLPEGKPLEGLSVWKWGHDKTLDYPREHLLPRGPMPSQWMHYNGHYLHNNKVVLSYAIDEREILELPDAPGSFPALQHTLRIGPGKKLILAVGSVSNSRSNFSGKLKADAIELRIEAEGELAVLGSSSADENTLGNFVSAAAWGDTEGLMWSWDEEDHLVLEIPGSQEERLIQVIRYAGNNEANLLSFANFLRSKKLGRKAPLDPRTFITGGDSLWSEILESSGELGDPFRAYTMDTIGLPENDSGNPYNAWFRTSALAFFPDGRMVVTTHGGDVWIVYGVNSNLKNLRWKRHAAGLYEPFGVLVIDGLVYVTCKDRLTRLHDFNGDGEADFYESFSADNDVSTWFHAFNFDLQRDPDGNLYYAKAGMYTDYREPGSIIRISPDGKKREIYCTGLRTPNGMGMMPDGRPTVSDNQGTWMPASKISLAEPGGYYGYVQDHASTNWAPGGGAIDHTKVTPPSTFDQPIIWMPQEFDNSSGGQLFVDDPRWGPLSGKLLHTSFGKGWLYYTMIQEVNGTEQASIVKFDFDASTGIHRAQLNPADGQVYATGLNGWNGGGRLGLAQGGIHRFRYTGEPAKLLTNVNVEQNGIRLEFNFTLAPEAATNVESYKLEQWNYLWSTNYGSGQYSIENDWNSGTDKVTIEKVVLGERGKSVLLVIPDIQPVNQVQIDLDLLAADGNQFNEQAYLTINAVPGGNHPTMKELTIERTAFASQNAERLRAIAKQIQIEKRANQEAAAKAFNNE